jgi:hypothetical protein
VIGMWLGQGSNNKPCKETSYDKEIGLSFPILLNVPIHTREQTQLREERERERSPEETDVNEVSVRSTPNPMPT